MGVGTFNETVLHSDPVGSVVTHGIAGGAIASSRGGRFELGFLPAAFSKWMNPYIDQDIPGNTSVAHAERIVASAIIGGTASGLAGGSFESGAVTAAFARMYNDENEHRDRIIQREREEIEGELKNIPRSKSGPLKVDGIKPVGPGGDSIPGGKGVGTLLTKAIKYFQNKINPHYELEQTQQQLATYYYLNRDRVADVCYRCHSP